MNNRNDNKPNPKRPEPPQPPGFDTGVGPEVEIEFSQDELMKYLRKCNRDFLDQMILTYGQKGLEKLETAHSATSKRQELYKLMIADENQEAMGKKYLLIRDLYYYETKSATVIAKAKEEYQATMDEYKGGLEARVANIEGQFPATKEVEDGHRQLLGKQKRSKIIANGLKSYGKAVAVAHIDGVQDQVIASGMFVAAQASEVAKRQDLQNSKTEEQTKTFLRNVNPIINANIASLFKDNGEPNGLANRLAAEAKHERDTALRKTMNVVTQPVGS